jgi:hypothetical protein
LLIGIYLYFHLYIQKLCDELGLLPAIFPDGKPLQSKADPWLLSDLVRSHVSKLKADRPFLSYLQGWISILLAWWVVPITLICFWARYLPRHDNVLTAFHCVLTAISIVAAIFLYRLASSTLAGTRRTPFVWSAVLKEPASLQPIFVVIVVLITFALISTGAIDGVRSGVPGRDWWPLASGPPRWIPAVMEKLGYSPFADLRGADLSLKPTTWIGKSDTELDGIKGPQLSGVDLRYADMRGVFLVGALLTNARLDFADLLLADLRQTVLTGAHLENSDLEGAHLNGATLINANLSNSELAGADLTGAELKYANLREVKGLSPDTLAKAKDWKTAFYSREILEALELPENNNDLVQKQEIAEREALNQELARIEQYEESIPGGNAGATELTTWVLTHIGRKTVVTKVAVQAEDVALMSKPFFTVADVARIYNFPSVDTPEHLDGRGQTIGIIEFGGGYKESDLDAYFSHFRIPKPTIVSVSLNHIENNLDSPDLIQVEQDIEIPGSVAPGTVLVVYFSDFTEQGWLDAISTAIHDATYRPSILLIGWGTSESNKLFSSQFLRALDQEFVEAATLGITVVTANGTGSDVDFPASSPHVLAVGGTEIKSFGNPSPSEMVNTDFEGGASGEFSQFFPRPEWQSQVPGPRSIQGLFGRAVPDVAANAWPGYQLLVDGKWEPVGGAGGAAALWAGLIALLNQGLGSNVGFLNPRVYKQLGPSGALKPVANGDHRYHAALSNHARSGWNPATGWGTPDGRKILEVLRSLK